MTTLYQWIVEHFRNYRKKKPWTFFWQIFLELSFIALTLLLVLAQYIPESNRFESWSATSLVIVLILIAPPLETLFLQALPISIARYFGLRLELQIICSLLPFSLLHITDGSSWGLIPGVVGGVYFAFTYAHWKDQEESKAFGMTTALHMSYNALLLLLAFLGKYMLEQ